MEETIYLYSAVAGSTLVVLQIILQVFGFLGGGDFEAHSDMDLGDVADSHDTHLDGAEGHGNLFFGILSFKALCAFAGIFGLVGLTLLGTDLNTQARVAIAFSSGMAGMFLVGWMMRGMARLQSSGSIRIRNAIGRSGSVYLRIPAGSAGVGKVTIEIQGRTQEFPAITEGREIGTGTRVTVVAVESDDTLKVVHL